MMKKILWLLLAAGLAICLGACSGTGDTDTVPDTWWARFARFSNNGAPSRAKEVSADAVTAMSGFHDEGIGGYAFNTFFLTEAQANMDYAKANGVKVMAWIELMGETRCVIGAVNETAPGVFEIDPVTGAPKLTASFWSWNHIGPGLNPAANKIIWMGVHSFVNAENWNGPYLPKSLTVPSYPGGASALGLLKPGSIDPRDYKFYDALAGKSVFGTFIEQEQFGTPAYENLEGFIRDSLLSGADRYVGDFYFSRDISADWWLEYNRRAVAASLAYGADGFWTDNYSGWGYLGSCPVYRAFGEWTVAGFAEYLKQNPVPGIDPAGFDIREYLLEKLGEAYPYADLEDQLAVFSLFLNEEWLEDPVWLRFLSFKSFEISRATKAFYAMVKEEAKKQGLDPEQIAVAGNDVPLLHNGGVDKNDIDIVSSEYSPAYSPVTGHYFDRSPLAGWAGTHYKLMTELSRSGRGSVWYYLDGPEAQNEELAKLLSFEALASNVTVNSGGDNTRIIGTDASAKFVNDAVGALREGFASRKTAGSVALYNSSNSELFMLTPGGYARSGAIPSAMGFYGWGAVFEQLLVPYRVITEGEISKSALEGVDILVMANIETVSKAVVEKTLIPFLNSGKTLVITGENAGARDIRDGNFEKHASPLLSTLAADYSGKGKIVFFEDDPTEQAYIDKEYSGAKAEVSALLDTLAAEGRYSPDLLTDIAAPAAAAIHRDASAKLLFADFANRDIDAELTGLSPVPAGTVRVKIPEFLKGKKLTATINTVNAGGAQSRAAEVKIENGYAVVALPEFLYYASLRIEGK